MSRNTIWGAAQQCFFRQRISIALCLGDLIFVTSKPSSFLNLLMTDTSRWFYCHFQILTLLLPVYLRKQHASLLHHYRVGTTLGLVWFGFDFVSFGLIQLLVSVLWKVRSDRVLLVALVYQGSLNFWETVRMGGIGSSERLINVHGMQGGSSFQVPLCSLMCCPKVKAALWDAWWWSV